MNLSFDVVGAAVEPYAFVPTIMLKLRITEADRVPVHAIALKCQIRIEPQRRTYDPAESERLYEVFGERRQWGESLRPFLWTHVATTVTAFTGETTVDLPVECTYDFEVSGTKYLHSLDGGDIPLVLLFNGTAFGKGDGGFSIEPVAWHEEATYRLPVKVWRNVMDVYFPNSGWLRMDRDTIDALTRFKSKRALPTWDQTIAQLLKEAGEES
jgi:hypothetical protein